MTEKMKDSGIEWIGEIPEEWDCKKLKYIIANPLMYGANETGNDFDEQYPRYIRITDINENNSLKEEGRLSLLPEVAKPYLLEEGDMLFARSGATVGKTFLYRKEYGKAAFAGYLIKAHFNRGMVLPKYVYYSTLGSGYDNWKNTVFTQATIQNIGADKYSVYQIPIPSILEQQAISDFLDKKVGQVDDILADLNKQVEILNQYKKSLITETVTRGLNPNVEMKDSGIDWIGEIPKAWKIKPLKYFAQFYNGDRSENYPLNSELVNDGIPFVNAGDIINGKISFQNMSYITEEKYNSMGGLKIQDNDLIYCLRGSVGKNALVHFSSGTVNSCMVGIRCRKGMNSKYFYYCMNSYIEDNWRYVLSSGSVQAQMGADILKIYKIPFPNVVEQQAIADYLDKKCDQIDDLIADKQKQIEKMKSYKKSLIYEYVTGKKRVGV